MILTRENCTKKQAVKIASRTSAWRLFSGKVDKINTNYHSRKISPDYKNIKIPVNQLYRYAAAVLKNYMPVSDRYFQDVVGESILRFLEKSGSNPGTPGALGSIVFFTYLDWRKKSFLKKEILCLDQQN